MGYPDQKDDQDTRFPVEDSERTAGDDRVVVGEVVEPDEDRLVDVGPDEPAPAPTEASKHRYTGDEAGPDGTGPDPLVSDLDEPAAGDDQVVLDSSDAGPVEASPAGASVASAAADGGPDRVGSAIPMPSSTTADGPGPVRTPDGPAGPGDVTNPDPVPGAGGTARDATSASAQDHDWREIMAMFVDDPRAATERAASVVDGSVEDLIRSLKGEQESLRSSWQGDSTDTERLRTALKDYRSLWQRLDGMAGRH